MVPKFLLVDDDPEALKLLSTILESLGCEAHCVDKGAKALEVLEDKAQAGSFDAVFLDVLMPEMTGLEVLQRLKQLPQAKELPVLMITSEDTGEKIVTGYNVGADYYITKPFTKEQIVYGLDMVLGEQAQDSGDSQDGAEDQENKEKTTYFLPEA